MNHYRTLLVGLGIAAVLAGAGFGFLGCSRSGVEDDGTPPPQENKKSPREYLEAAITSLGGGRSAAGKDPFNVDSARDAVENLNAYLKALASTKPALTLPDSQRARLRKQFGLTADDLGELNSSVFTLLDAYYLQFCFQLADVARSLDLQGMSTLQRARLGFDWVTRQVSLRERGRRFGIQNREYTPLPPQFVLQFGYGTAQERSLVFLALLQQLGIDGGLVACPNENGNKVYWVPAVLVSRAEKDRSGKQTAAGIYLFDTRLGMPLPGPGGEPFGRFDQVVKAPDACRARFAESIRDQAVPDGIARAEVHLACPLSALSPRMKFLERKMTTSTRVLLALDPKKILERCKKTAPGRVQFSSARHNPNNPTRVLRTFLYPGGRIGDLANRLMALRRAQLPVEIWKKHFPVSLHSSLHPMVLGQIAPVHEKGVVEARTAMVRGQVDQAIKLLEEGRNILLRGKDVLKGETKDEGAKEEFRQKVNDWCRKFSEAKLKVSQLQAQEQEGEGDQDKLQEELASAKARLGALWKNNQDILGVIVYVALAEPLGKESGFLHCLCIQEKAERLQTRLQRLLSSPGQTKAAELARAKARVNARKEWENAEDGWRKHISEYGISDETLKARIGELVRFELQASREVSKAAIATALHESLILDLSRTVAAHLLLARAQEYAGKPAKAMETLEEQQRDLGAWETNGHLEALKQFVRGHQAFSQGTPFSRPETISWLEAAVAYQLERLKRLQ
jgi:hypothetical protein